MNASPNTAPYQMSLELDDYEADMIESLNLLIYNRSSVVSDLKNIFGAEAADMLFELVDSIHDAVLEIDGYEDEEAYFA